MMGILRSLKYFSEQILPEKDQRCFAALTVRKLHKPLTISGWIVRFEISIALENPS